MTIVLTVDLLSLVDNISPHVSEQASEGCVEVGDVSSGEGVPISSRPRVTDGLSTREFRASRHAVLQPSDTVHRSPATGAGQSP